jgi:F-type H+-transporting ATPase subunit b
MHFDATFFAFVAFLIFIVGIVYLKVPGMMAKSLDDRAGQIRDELAEAKRLREEAQHLLAEYQRKRKEAEAEAASIVAVAEREAKMLAEEAKQKTEDYVARRNALSEQKIKQAETDAVNAVRSAAVDLAIAAAEKVLADKVDGSVKEKLFNASVEQVRTRLN